MTHITRVAAIDIGTVTCRLLLAETDGTHITTLAKRSTITNLGEGVDATSHLLPEAIERVSQTVAGYLAEIERFEREVPLPSGQEKTKLVALATSASRDAQNSHVFIERLAQLGVNLSIIPGEREAQFSFLGASREFAGEHLLVVDSGGGSTEVIVGVAGGQPSLVHSFDIGCRRVTERFLHSDPPTSEELEAARVWVREQFQSYFDKVFEEKLRIDRVIAVAGTATSMVSVRDRLVVYDSKHVHGARMEAHSLDQVFDLLASLPLEQRKQVIGLQPQRAAVIVGGALILQELLRVLGVQAYTASESDILQGIILSAV